MRLFLSRVKKLISSGLKFGMDQKHENTIGMPPMYKIDTALQGMTSLRKEAFTQAVQYDCVQVPHEKCAQISKVVKPYFVKLPNFKSAQDANEREKRFVLNPLLVKESKDLDENLQELGVQIRKELFHIGYDNLNFQQISRLILPNNQTLSGFSLIGHIAHFNLRDEILPFKYILGEVVLDKLASVKTVVNKTHSIESEFRNFHLELLAGDDNTVANVVEHGVKFRLDFAKVYWNPRLSQEHKRVSDLITKNITLFDAFCGVGPFALPAAKKGCKVFANDLNPESVKWLKENVKLNKIREDLIKVSNLDAREYFESVMLPELISFERKAIDKPKKFALTMNLPSLAHEFLHPLKLTLLKLKNRDCAFLVFFYCFVSKDDKFEEAVQLAGSSLLFQQNEIKLFEEAVKVHEVRGVSSNKVMMCVSFDLGSILKEFESKAEIQVDSDSKRIKLS